jgi:eukaryotic-like serine/threonine-protein kinase
MADTVIGLGQALKDRYTLERELGRGGMAAVYLAHDLKHDRRVALKVMEPSVAATLGPERFLREIQVTARLDHPNIVPVFGLRGGRRVSLVHHALRPGRCVGAPWRCC